MAMYDPETGEYNDVAYSLDTHAAQANDKSIFESAGDLVTKAAPLTAVSIVNSFANTAIDIGNFFGADWKRMEVQDWVEDPEYLDYYKQHETGIEVAGLAIGSLAPGLGAIKALKLLQNGASTSVIARATGIFSAPRQRIIEGALKEINAGDAALYGSMNADKYKAIALGFGDQALQGLVYEVATAATMKASPILDKAGYDDVLSNMFFGALVGGGIGGVIEGIGTRSIFAKAQLNANNLTKAQELATYLGKLNVGNGDKVAALLKSIEDIPEPTNLLGAKKLSATKDAAELNAKKLLGGLVEEGDQELTNRFYDVLLDMKQKGGMGSEEMYNYLARLSRVSRIDSPAETASGTIFYINRFSRSSEAPTISSLISNAPGDTAEFSLGYRLSPFSTDIKVARHSDVFEWEGRQTPAFNTAQEAFDAGHDIFFGPKNTVFVNPKAPNLERVARPGESRPLTVKEEKVYRATGVLPEGSKPLYGAPVVLNTSTGAITESATPVIGDYGAVKLFDKGIMYGDRTSLHSLTEGLITSETSHIDANARYVWASMRGTKAGDTIAAGDIPMLEQLFREASVSKEGFEKFMEKAAKRNISIAGEELPATSDGLLMKIRNAKDDLISETLTKNSKVSSAELSQLANVPESYLESGLKAIESKEYMADISGYQNVNHVKLEYDIGNIYQQDGQILRGMIDVQYRVHLAEEAAKSTTAKFFGIDFGKFLSRQGADKATIEGAGSKLFTAASAAYGSLAQEMERIGREVTEWHKARMAAVSDTLYKAVTAIRNDPEASAELGMFIAVRRRTSQTFTFMPADIAQAEGMSQNTVVLADSLKRGKDGKLVWDRSYTPEGFVDGKAAKEGTAGQYTYYTLGEKVADFERASASVNNQRVAARNNWYAAQGMNRTQELDNLYAPPIDTNKYQHFALVKARPGTGLADDSVAIITAENAKELEQKIALLSNDYSVYTKDLIKKHHEVIGDYDYNRNFAQSSVDAALRRKGILNNVFPDTRSETIIKDYIDWHTRQELRLTRDYVELGNSQLFAELRAMGERFTAAETSRTGFTSASLGRTAPNPYNSYIKTALGVSEKEEYRLWHEANEKLEAFFSTAFRAAKSSFTAASKGIISFEEAGKVGERFGLGNPYAAATDTIDAALKAYYGGAANKLPPERYLSKFVSTANSILSATAIRLDVFQSVINAISTPVLLLAESNSARNSALKELLTTELPDGSGRMIPATSKLFFNSLGNYFNRDARETYMPLYKAVGAVRDKSSEFHEMIDHLALPYGKFSESELLKNLKLATDKAAKLTGSELSEEFGRFIAADVGRQIFEAAGYTGTQLTDNISTFVNRVHGNYVASQRPIAFQGPIGQAVGLFQTYQFNLLQQVFRYVENGEAKTLGILAGMQTTLFGFQGLPGFQAINNHIIGNAAGNPAHKDIYGITPNFFDKKLGDYLLYGVTSNWINTGLYSRGDINPRQITILPTNPADYPAISGGIRFVGSLLDTADKISQGASVSASLLLGLEHNGLSRPLTGLAQMAQGYVTTGKGSLVAATRDNTTGMSELFSVANFSRLLGARPLEEAIFMDAMYRKTLYQAKDTSRINEVGQAVKTTFYAGGSPSQEEVTNFMARYTDSGGHIETFGRKMIEWSRDANISVANQLYRHLKNPLNQQMMTIMGGVQLPDYSTTTPQSVTATPSGN